MRRILLPIDPSVYTKTALKYASGIAKYHQSKIEGVAILDKLSVTEQVSTLVPLPLGNEEYLEKEKLLLEKTRARIKKEIASFRRYCRNYNLSCDTKSFEGRPDFVIGEESKYFDLIIVGMRNYFHFETSTHPEKPLNQILDQTSTPILAVPEKHRPIKNVLIAYDGSLPSLRATQRFLYLMRGYDYEITLLVQDKCKEDANAKIEKMENYIAHHGVTDIKKVWTNKSLIKTFEEDFLENTDLVVCGMHAQNFIRKFFIGSFPKFLIDINIIPVFIGQ